MNRLVDSIGEQNLHGIESEKIRDLLFNRLAFGIARQELRIERPQAGQHARRTSHCALVEIEAQSGSSRQRWPISVEMFYRVASFKHESTALGMLPRVPSSLRRWPA